MNNERWPFATDFSLLPQTEEDRKYRGQAIIELLIDEFDGKFLDMGCGDGHAAVYASKYAELSVGYDIKEYDWHVHEQTNKFILTTDYNIVLLHHPYKVILAFDVLDHIYEDQKEVLRKIHKLLDRKGLFYLRTHPWQSRHATHNLNNLAYIHLYETPAGVYHAKKETHNLLEECGFSIVKKREIHEEIEPFFLSIDSKLLNKNEKPQTLQYIDYIVKKREVILL